MFDLLDSTFARPAERLSARPAPAIGPQAAVYPVGHAGTRALAYGGPERRGAASLPARRMAQMLDTLDYGMLLVDDLGAVTHVNKAARRDLDAMHPLQLVGSQLQARLGVDAQPLHDALMGATRRGLRRLLWLGEGAQRVSVAVVPLPALGADALPGATLLLGKRQVCEALTVDWFARSHGLTMAETAVMRGLCADLTPIEIAARQGVGLATIRTQIGNIRIKTGACSIRALVRQVAVLPPLVSALHSPAGQMPAASNSDRVLNS